MVCCSGLWSLCSLIADFLAFHDIWEPHSGKDWLILIASLLAVAYAARLTATQVRGLSRH